MQQTEKKRWATPALTVHGDVAAITQNRVKTIGNGDGIILVIPGIVTGPGEDVPMPS